MDSGPESTTHVETDMFADLILLLGLVYCIYEIRELNMIVDRRGNNPPSSKED